MDVRVWLQARSHVSDFGRLGIGLFTWPGSGWQHAHIEPVSLQLFSAAAQRL